MNWSRQRLYASLLALGATILLFRTLMMLTQGALSVLVIWVSGLLILELVLDVTTLLGAVRWWMTSAQKDAGFALRAGAAATILHALRVLIFVLGRTGPWIDFDVKPEHRALHSERWNWGEVYFAATLSVLGVVGVIIIWQYWRRQSNKD